MPFPRLQFTSLICNVGHNLSLSSWCFVQLSFISSSHCIGLVFCETLGLPENPHALGEADRTPRCRSRHGSAIPYPICLLSDWVEVHEQASQCAKCSKWQFSAKDKPMTLSARVHVVILGVIIRRLRLTGSQLNSTCHVPQTRGKSSWGNSQDFDHPTPEFNATSGNSVMRTSSITSFWIQLIITCTKGILIYTKW